MYNAKYYFKRFKGVDFPLEIKHRTGTLSVDDTLRHDKNLWKTFRTVEIIERYHMEKLTEESKIHRNCRKFLCELEVDKNMKNIWETR